ncbi:MAG: SDR family NAD(P)-dependent oxidoreductase [Acidimicrobiales bacterium]
MAPRLKVRSTTLEGKVVIVTGASSGIGAATATAMAKRGASVVAVARRMDRLEETVKACGPEALAVTADVADPESAERVVRSALDRFRSIDVLVNNAGIDLHKDAAETTFEEIERVFAVNFFGAVRLTLAVLPTMIAAGGGTVVSVTSVAGYLPNPREAAYGASKAALSLWSDGVGVDLHDRGIHVAVVSPGPIDTEIWGHGPQSYDGKLYPASVVADAIVDVVEGGRSRRTAPRRFGVFGPMYAVAGAPMRWGLRRFGSRERR